MARAKSSLATIIIVALVLVLLYALNPTMDDFKAWQAASVRTDSGSNSGLSGVLKKGVGAMKGAIAGLSERKDYLICSTYSLGGKNGDLYLGAARLFVKLK